MLRSPTSVRLDHAFLAVQIEQSQRAAAGLGQDLNPVPVLLRRIPGQHQPRAVSARAELHERLPLLIDQPKQHPAFVGLDDDLRPDDAAVVDDLEAPGPQDVRDGLRPCDLLLRSEGEHGEDVEDGEDESEAVDLHACHFRG